ncbi:nuclear transport factor 2 family protein [Microbacterium sp. QXD-8]|uniref:Nuclear transport factor 2 family protein n=1 Tax=Microbacterium psychrotolerans TaxID=3068321 RepID=A0ABU0YY37_9MICO|nr:nuclear transport factor 2 family protein [Microbacterium sp. QXD-8]MDQ7876509.1 nuclear transport factor 2 family protein [Microbacterium sp. QXD-8]
MDDQRLLFELRAERDIARLQARYSALCDDGFPPAAIGELFVEDAVWESSPHGVRCEGRAQIAAHFESAGPMYPWSMHINVPLGVDVAGDGDTADGAWHLLMPCIDRSTGAVTAGWLAGKYLNTFVRVDGEWRFQHLRIAFELMTPHLTDWAVDRFQHGARP